MKEEKVIYVPKIMHDLMKPSKMSYHEMIALITVISFVYDDKRKDNFIKSGYIEFTEREYLDRFKEIENDVFEIKIILPDIKEIELKQLAND